MIARLSGTLCAVSFTECIVDVNGVGYQVFIPLSTFDLLPREGEDVSLFIYTQVREDAISLYGFGSLAEKQLFEVLITTSGIGPKLALSILSSMPVEHFASAIVNANMDVIKRISGIGKKTAERLIVELRDKLAKMASVSPGEGGASSANTPALEDAASALEQLGFKQDAIHKTLNKIIGDIPEAEASSENLIRKALQALNS